MSSAILLFHRRKRFNRGRAVAYFEPSIDWNGVHNDTRTTDSSTSDSSTTGRCTTGRSNTSRRAKSLPQARRPTANSQRVSTHSLHAASGRQHEVNERYSNRSQTLTSSRSLMPSHFRVIKMSGMFGNNSFHAVTREWELQPATHPNAVQWSHRASGLNTVQWLLQQAADPNAAQWSQQEANISSAAVGESRANMFHLTSMCPEPSTPLWG